MDNKITKKRLKNLIVYDLGAFIISFIAIIAVWSLIFTTTATRITTGQDFYFVVYEGVYESATDKSETFLDDVSKKALSFDVLKSSIQSIVSSDMYGASYMLNLRMTTQDCDVGIFPSGRNGETFDKDGNSSITMPTDYEGLASNKVFYTINDLLESALNYVTSNKFINITDSGYELNEEMIKNYFRNVRLESSNYKKLYKSEKQILEAVDKEIDRIENIYLNYLAVTSAIENAQSQDKDFLYYTKTYNLNQDGEIVSYNDPVAFGIDLGKLPGKTVNGKTVEVFDYWFVSDGNTEDLGYTSNGLIMAVFDFSKFQYDMQFESLAMLRYTIETFSDYI